MNSVADVVAAIGHTPLIKLRRASEATGCTILGKAEFMNPGQSVKDRPARQIILEAEKRHEIEPGGLVVERGSMLSHSAIVAREMGIPAVVGVSGATTQIRTGDRLLLDGAKGSVHILRGRSRGRRRKGSDPTDAS